MADDSAKAPPPLFAFFNEVGIINQLARALFEARLPEGVTVAHFSVLNHLIRVRDGQTPLKLAEAFQVPKTTMTHTLAGLEARAFVETRRHPGDGRSKQVWLTEAGRAFRDEAIDRLGPDMQALSQSVDMAEVSRMLPALEAIRKVMDDARD